MVTDLYAVLGLARTASAADVKKAYLALARESHPDRFAEADAKAKAEDRFQAITEAFNTLTHAGRREAYDRELARGEATPQDLAKEAFAKGSAAFERKDYHDAVEQFRLAIELVPTDARFHHGLARALAKNPHWVREAIQSAEKAVQLAPRAPALHVGLATLLLSQGLKLRARRSAEAAFRLAPEDPEVRKICTDAGVFEGGDEDPPPEDGGLLGRLRRKG